MQEEVGKVAPPRPKKRQGASEYFLAFALLHAGCGEEVIEARLDKRAQACWCLEKQAASLEGATMPDGTEHD